MSETPQEIYDAEKILNATIRDKKNEIKEAENNSNEIGEVRDEISELKKEMKKLKKKEKLEQEAFKKKNQSLYDSLESLKNQKNGSKDRFFIAMLRDIKNDVVTEIWDENNGNPKRVIVTFTPKTKKE